MIDKFELNPFEIKAEITNIFSKLSDIKDFDSYEIHYKTLDMQKDKTVITKLLFKEINNTNVNQELLKFLLVRYCPKNILTEKLWDIIKSNLSSNQSKIFALDLLRDIDTNWSYDECDKYIENPEELVNSDTKKILNNAIINPEVQIDFLDFLHSLPEHDQIVLLQSLGEDYSKDELANMLVPVFLTMSDTETGKVALDILGNSKSQLAYHALSIALDFVQDSLKPIVNKNLSILKLSGIREDNSIDFYKSLLKESKPYKFCITYPDGEGNQAVIFSRINKQGKVQFVAIVIDDYNGVVDCFGFNEISKFECNTIIERFYRGQRALDLKPEILKSLLVRAEKISKNKLPYEYVCWRNLLADVKEEPIKIKYEIEKLSDSEFEEILKCDFTDYWFLNNGYSKEFDSFMASIDSVLPEDYDKYIDDNLENVFTKNEYEIWSERLLNVAFLKHLAGKDNTARKIYSLYNDKTLKREFLKNILRKSIYEAYFAKKDIDKINAIEKMWVK